MLIHGQLVLGTQVHRCGEHSALAALVALVLEADKVRELVFVIVHLIIDADTIVVVDLQIVESVEGKCSLFLLQQEVVTPVDEAQVVDGSTDLQSFHHLVLGTQVDAQSEATDARTLDLGLTQVYMLVAAAAVLIVCRGVMELYSLHVDVAFSVSAIDEPLVARHIGCHS